MQVWDGFLAGGPLLTPGGQLASLSAGAGTYLVIGETLEVRQWLGIVLVVAASAGCTLTSAVADRRPGS